MVIRKPLIGAVGTVALTLALVACADNSDTSTSTEGTDLNGTVTILIPNAPGGLADNSVRPIQQPLSEALGVDVVIENMPGAGGMLAANTAYNAEPDGTTLLAVVQPSAVLSDVYEDESPPYLEFEFLGRLTGEDSMALAVRADSEYESVDDLKQAHDQGNDILNGTISGMNNQTLSQVIFTEKTGIEFDSVPYEGGAETTRAVIDGVVDVAFASLTSLAGPVDDGEVKVLTYFADEPIDTYQDYDLFADQYEGAGFTVGVGIVAPPETPEGVLTILREALETAANDERYIEKTEGSINPAYLEAEAWKKQFSDIYDLLEQYSDSLEIAAQRS